MIALRLGVFSLTLVALSVAAPAAEPEITPAPKPGVAKRATSCTFSGSAGAASASKSATSCATIVLSNVAVPSGTTLDLSGLADDTTVIFQGTTTWGYQEWAGPLLNIGGNKITVQGASGHVLNPDGARWWDGKGGNGGKTKPKFFAAHDLTDSTISNINIKNTPVQAVSIAGCDGLTITGMTIDDSAGDSGSLGHNTDGFDIGTSSNVVIDGAKVYNQDDCVAVNSGTVSRGVFHNVGSKLIVVTRASRFRMASALVDMVCPSALLVVDQTTLLTQLLSTIAKSLNLPTVRGTLRSVEKETDRRIQASVSRLQLGTLAK